MRTITQRRRFGTKFLDRLYAIPDPMRSIDDYYKQRHDDLPLLTTEKLHQEARMVRQRADLEDDEIARWWLGQRLDRVRAELTRRRSAPPKMVPDSRTPGSGGGGDNRRPAQPAGAFEFRGGRVVRR